MKKGIDTERKEQQYPATGGPEQQGERASEAMLFFFEASLGFP